MVLLAPTNTDGPNVIGWGGISTRHFMVHCAYNMQTSNLQSIEWQWGDLWGRKGPHRIQTFMWMAAHKGLLTNHCRSKWGVGIDPLCNGCAIKKEIRIHDEGCLRAAQIWLRLVPSVLISNLFSLNCRE